MLPEVSIRGAGQKDRSSGDENVSDTFTSTELFLGDGGRIEIVSESRRQVTFVDSSIVKGPIRIARFPRPKFGRRARTLVRDCIRPYFSEQPT